MSTIIIVSLVIIVLVIYAIYQLDQAPKKQALNEHYDLSQKLMDKGADTHNLKVAKECMHTLSASYDQIKDYASPNSRTCFEDDIDMIKANAEALAEELWQRKANVYLDRISELYWLIMDHNSDTVDSAYKSASKLMKAYDDLFDWTRKCFDDNRDVWDSIDIWDEARRGIKDILEEEEGYIFWESYASARASVRGQIQERVNKAIEEMRPEYKRKMSLIDKIMQYVSDNGTVQRSVLLRQSFEGFIAKEVESCYKGLVKEHRLIEAKQGNYYFVCLSDASAKKYPPKQAPDTKGTSKQTENAKEKDDPSIVDNKHKHPLDTLIRHFTDNKIEFVDKTDRGGSLYFFDKNIADDLKGRGYEVLYAENGSKSTGYRPAWYIRNKE